MYHVLGYLWDKRFQGLITTKRFFFLALVFRLTVALQSAGGPLLQAGRMT